MLFVLSALDPTTLHPSPNPTQAPSKDCVNFMFGSKCNWISSLDVTLILDSASLREENFATNLEQTINSNFPEENSNLAIIQFATSAETIKSFDSDLVDLTTIEPLSNFCPLVFLFVCHIYSCKFSFFESFKNILFFLNGICFFC